MGTPKRQKRTTQARKPRQESSFPVAVSSSTGLILELPLEVMEMIIGNVSIIDLQSFRDSSPLINHYFEGSRYGALHRLITKYEKGVFFNVVSKMEQFPLVHWRTHDVFKAFTDATCDNEIHSSSSTKRCGATAPHLFWFSVPVQRLCNPCYQKVEASEFFLLTTLRKHYKLKPKDVAAIPIHIVSPGTERWRTGTVVASRKQVEQIAKAKHGENCPSSLERPTQSLGYDSGVAKTVLVLDPVTNKAMTYLSCSRCYSWNLRRPAIPAIPYRFDFLRNHIELHHPELLDAFDRGWTNIGEEARKYWLRMSNISPFSGSNTYPMRPRYDDFGRSPFAFGPYMFKSWNVVLDEMSRDQFNKDPRQKAYKTKELLGDVLSSRLSRLNPAILNVPPMPDSESETEYLDDAESFRRSVAEHLAVQIMEKEMTRLVERIQDRSRSKKGFEDVIKEYAPDITWLTRESRVKTKIPEGSGNIEAPPEGDESGI